MALTDDIGNIVERYNYDRFGKPVFLNANWTPKDDQVSSLSNHVLFNGRWYDEESELYYYRSRYYNPDLGRVTSRDTLGIWADPLNLGNGYTYAANNPWTYSDPYGFRADLMHTLSQGAWDAGEAVYNTFAYGSFKDSYQGAMAGIDGVADSLSFGLVQPFENLGFYDSSQSGLGYSQAIGGYTINAMKALATGGGSTAADIKIQPKTNSGDLKI